MGLHIRRARDSLGLNRRHAMQTTNLILLTLGMASVLANYLGSMLLVTPSHDV